MKARNIIGAVCMIVGLFVAICTVDGSNHELAMRAGGIALVIAGGCVGDFFDIEKEERE